MGLRPESVQGVGGKEKSQNERKQSYRHHQSQSSPLLVQSQSNGAGPGAFKDEVADDANDGHDDGMTAQSPVQHWRGLLRKLERSLRGTCLGRLHRALCRARAAAPQGPVLGAPVRAEQARSRLDRAARLLPSRLPPLPDWFGRSEATFTGRRLRRRWRERCLAWRWAEWQVCYFNAAELGWPKDGGRAIRALPQGPLSAEQELAFYGLMEDNLRLGRLVAPLRREQPVEACRG